MDSVLRGWVIGHLLGETINRNRAARQRWCAVAYSPTSGTAYAWNHRTQHGAQTAALALCEGPQARLWACGAEITIAVARGPRGAYLPVGRSEHAHSGLRGRDCEVSGFVSGR